MHLKASMHGARPPKAIYALSSSFVWINRNANNYHEMDMHALAIPLLAPPFHKDNKNKLSAAVVEEADSSMYT